MRPIRFFAPVLTVALLGGCGVARVTHQDGTEGDGGTGDDAATPWDGGTNDGGAPEDGGTNDGGAPEDGGTNDGGTPEDGGTNDGGTPGDGGTNDGGSPGDGGADTTPPSIPAGLTVSATSCTVVFLSWNASTDSGGSGLRGYRVFRDGMFVGEVAVASFFDTGPGESTLHDYAVSAIDNVGNESARSTDASVTTPACPVGGSCTVGSNPLDGEMTDNLAVGTSRTFSGGTSYAQDPGLNGVIIVTADNIVIDGNCSLLDGSSGPSATQRAGFGIRLDGRHNVTIRNFRIRGFRYAIYATNSSNIVVEDSVLSDNYNDADIANWTTAGFSTGRPGTIGFLGAYASWSAMPLGGGVFFSNVTDSIIRRVTARHQSIGFVLVNSDRDQILNTDASENTAWGAYLYHSQYGLVQGNHFNNVWRNNMLDSASILLEVNSSHNRIVGNQFLDSADGFFARDNPPESGTLGNPFGGTNDDLYVAYNDGSGAGANAFEHTFSTGSLYVHNVANRSGYGFWLGVSDHFVLQDNEIKNNRVAGIAVEHGSGHRFYGNNFADNPVAIQLWRATGASPAWRVLESQGYDILGNQFSGDTTAISLAVTTASYLAGNRFSGGPTHLHLEGGSVGNVITRNAFSNDGGTPLFDNRNLAGNAPVFAEENHWGTTDAGAIAARIFDATDNPTVSVVDALQPLAFEPPRPVFALSVAYGTAPLTVAVDGAASASSAGAIMAYSWAFGDGAGATGASASHTYVEPGVYELVLFVTDTTGATAFVPRVVQVVGSAVVPSVVTNAATDVTASSATLNGVGNPNGLVSTGYFRWGTAFTTCSDLPSRLPGTGGSALGSGNARVAFSQSLTGLAINVPVFFCAVIDGPGGPSYGSVAVALPGSGRLPTVSALTATGATPSGVTLNGTLNPNNTTATAFFRYGTVRPATCDDSFGTRVPASGGTQGVGAVPQSFSQALSGLAAGATYYFCAIASNSAGTAFSNVWSFATADTPATGTAPALSATSTKGGWGVGPYSFTHTVSSPNALLLVGISHNDVNVEVTSATYANQPLTKVARKAGNGAVADLWWMVNPPVGAGSVVVTISGWTDVMIGATSWTGASQTSPIGPVLAATGQGTSTSLNVPSGSGEQVFDLLAATFGPTLTPGGGQSVLWNAQGGGNSKGAASRAAGAASVPMAWTLSQVQGWSQIAVPLRP